MKHKPKSLWNGILLAVVVMTLAAGAGWAGQAGLAVSINGKAASTDTRTINGRVYVPISDVAKALNMTVVKKADGYDLVPEGGANQLNGARQGKIGERLITPKWNFMVRDFRLADTYTEAFCQDKKTFTPKNTDETLLLVECTLENGLKKAQSPVLSERESGNTSLADAGGQSYPPLDFDARQLSGKFSSYEASALLPGAKSNFVLVFSVPKSTVPKALVFTLLSYPDDVGRKQTTDVRVALEK